MIAFLALCYAGLIWIIFFKLKLLKFNFVAKVVVTVVAILGLGSLVVAMFLFQPYSTAVRVYQYMIPVTARASGRVQTVPVRANVPIKAGEILFTIDRRTYQDEVNQLEASLRLARERLQQATYLLKQQVGKLWDVQKYEADVGVLEAKLATARTNLSYTTVVAPADGMLVNLALRPGDVVTANGPAVMTFVYDPKSMVIVPLSQTAVGAIQPQDHAEVALALAPGKIYDAHVDTVIWANEQGQTTPSGTLPTFNPKQAAQPYAVRLKVDDPNAHLPAGAAGAAAIYTSKAKRIRVIRKVIIRMYSWLNYLRLR
jgi:RND family efflux transporter MFP subunit